MVTVSGNSNPTNPTYPTNPTNSTNPTTINSGELTDKNLHLCIETFRGLKIMYLITQKRHSSRRYHLGLLFLSHCHGYVMQLRCAAEW